MTHIGSYTLQTLWCKEQAVEQRILTIHLLKVQLIGLQEQILVSEYSISQMLQQEVALFITHQRQSPTGLLYIIQQRRKNVKPFSHIFRPRPLFPGPGSPYQKSSASD